MSVVRSDTSHTTGYRWSAEQLDTYSPDDNNNIVTEQPAVLLAVTSRYTIDRRIECFYRPMQLGDVNQGIVEIAIVWGEFNVALKGHVRYQV